ncbi:Hsp20/alpha crystallin family protein [Eilatimonas milleporae]|uniref:HSP20 family molecular chaperone IbpA n=1 Tax=Eilatimonas milleporae TaxID=911205 RepID=A0A3M0CS17_9PROT|nr:Hsp20/alpha crystallin family protein [Eilatimonas milleporae]RMB12381.1 HSP20 family molecular chaperone IbpA [Eilatimonas milleporae]
MPKSSMPPPRPRPSVGPVSANSSQPGALVDGLTMLADMIGKALEHGTTEVSRSVQVPFTPFAGDRSDTPGGLEASLRVRTCAAAAAASGDARGEAGEAIGGGDADTQIRSPLVDIFDEGEEIVVAAEVPGCGLEDIAIDVDADGRGLTLTTQGARGFRRHFSLPATIVPDPMETSCKNGMLEVRLSKSAPDAPTPDDEGDATPAQASGPATTAPDGDRNL